MTLATSEHPVIDNRRFLVLLLAAALAGPTLVGCGSGEMETNYNQDQQNQQDNDDEELVDPDGIHIHIEFSPTRTAYDVGSSVTPSATVYDTDSRLEDAEVQWSVTPTEAVDRDGEDWTIETADTITFEACLLDAEGEPTSDCNQRDLVSTGDRRSIILQSPSPGEHFEGTQYSTIPVEGTVDDGLPVSSVFVNGQPAEIDDDGHFSHDLTPKFGVNNIVVEAFDGVTSRDSTVITNAMWAPEFAPVDTDDGLHASFNQALLVNLGQNFFDDGQPYNEISDSEVVTEDIADMFELLLENLDVTSELPDPVLDNDAVLLSVDDTQIHETDVEILTTDDGIEIFGQITEFQAFTEGSLSMSDNTVGLDGDVTATVSLMVRLDIEKVAADSSFDVDLDHFELAVEEASPNFEDEEANAVFEVADSMLRSQLEDIILDGVDTSFIDNLPDMLADMLQSLEEVMTDEEFALDLEFGEPVDVSFDGSVGQFTPVQGEGLDGFIDAETHVDADPVYPDHPGAAVLDPDVQQSPLFNESRVQIGIDIALLNTIFHSLWNAGFLDLEITELVPESFESLIDEGYAESLLPPVLVPSNADRNHDLLLELGQLEVELDWMDQHDRFGVNVEAGADMEVVDEQIAIDLADDFEIEVWIIETSEDEPVMSADELRDLLETIILPEIEDEVGDNLAFDLPLPELDILESYAADLAGMSLDVRLNRSPDIRNGYLMFDATLEGQHFLD